jgi:hypothetical protein
MQVHRAKAGIRKVTTAFTRRRVGRVSITIACTVGIVALLGVGEAGAALPDNRGWEMVSPVDKNGGQVDPPGAIAGGGVLQAAAGGGTMTYGSATAFGPEAVGSPPASQYLSSRAASGWDTANITTPVVSSSYGFANQGVPYQLFSPDLARGLLFNGDHCRGEASGCAVANPPLAGTDAPDGYENYYMLEGGSFEALISASDIAGRGLDPSTFDVRLAGASQDLRTVVLSSCSVLAPGATNGCGAGKQNLYKWTQGGAGLTLVNTAPGAELAAQSGAISSDGSRIYWRDVNSGNLYLREGAGSTQVDTAAGGGGAFQTASSDGSVAFYTKAGHLWRNASGTSTDLTPGGGVAGVLGASADGSVVYFQDGTGLQRWAGSTTLVAAGATAADPTTYPPTTGASRVSADGTKLLFVSKAPLTGYNNNDLHTGLPDSEVFLYDSAGPGLTCVSCNPGGTQPIGPSTIPGAVANGTAPGSVDSYKPRALSANGHRVFFNSGDAIVITDSNSQPTTGAGIPDVYEWEAEGEGTCGQAGGCVAVISSGYLPESSSFMDASSDGADVYFLTESSLAETDPGSNDLYDARVGGGFARPLPQIPCEGDACQVLPAVPRNPTLATLVTGAGNPEVVYHKYCRKGYVKRKAICVKRGKHHGGGKG